MKGILFLNETDQTWYVKWFEVTQMYPSVPSKGVIKLHPDDVEIIEIHKMYFGVDKTLQDKYVDFVELEGYAKLVEPGSWPELSLYSQIEHEIISWSIDGTKTAGTLTRKIMELIEKNNQK